MRIGLLGGSFDPIHKGHVAAALAVLRARGLDRVYLLPAASPPHKGSGCRAPFDDRVQMARLATEAVPELEVLDLEGRRAGPSYTIETLEVLRRTRPDAEFELLVGTDMLADLPSWRRADEVVATARIVAFGRPGFDAESARSAFEERFGPGRHCWVEIEPVAASSTEVRRRLEEGGDPAELLEPQVFTFIRQKGLYGIRKGP